MSDGIGCKCAAHSENDCCCGADWTTQEVYDLRKQLDDSQKQVVMLREVVNRNIECIHFEDTGPEAELCVVFSREALAATADLDGLILCDAVEVGWIGTGPRDRRCEFSESKPANSVMRDFNMKPLYRAWEPTK